MGEGDHRRWEAEKLGVASLKPTATHPKTKLSALRNNKQLALKLF